MHALALLGGVDSFTFILEGIPQGRGKTLKVTKEQTVGFGCGGEGKRSGLIFVCFVFAFQASGVNCKGKTNGQ